MGLFDWSKRKKKNPDPPSPATAPAPMETPGPNHVNYTTMDREHFTILAPFQWKLVSGSNPLEFEFRNQTLPEQLVVTVLLFRERQTPDSLSTTSERLATARVSAVRELSKGKAVVQPVQLNHSPNQAEARCFGHDSDSNVRFAWAIRVTPDKAVTVALTRYILKEIGSPFSAYSGTIFDLMKVK